MYKKAWCSAKLLFGQSKGLFTWEWGTPGRWGNLLRRGNPPVLIISHFNLITLIYMIGGVTMWEIIWRCGLPHRRGLPHLPGVPHLQVNRLYIYCFLPFLLMSPLSLLKLPNKNYETNLWCSLRKDKVVWMHSQMCGWILLKWMDIYEEELKTIIISKTVMNL